MIGVGAQAPTPDPELKRLGMVMKSGAGQHQFSCTTRSQDLDQYTDTNTRTPGVTVTPGGILNVPDAAMCKGSLAPLLIWPICRALSHRQRTVRWRPLLRMVIPAGES